MTATKMTESNKTDSMVGVEPAITYPTTASGFVQVPISEWKEMVVRSASRGAAIIDLKARIAEQEVPSPQSESPRPTKESIYKILHDYETAALDMGQRFEREGMDGWDSEDGAECVKQRNALYSAIDSILSELETLRAEKL